MPRKGTAFEVKDLIAIWGSVTIDGLDSIKFGQGQQGEQTLSIDRTTYASYTTQNDQADQITLTIKQSNFDVLKSLSVCYNTLNEQPLVIRHVPTGFEWAWTIATLQQDPTMQMEIGQDNNAIDMLFKASDRIIYSDDTMTNLAEKLVQG